MAFEDVPLGSGGAAPTLTRSTSRQCLACQYKAKLLPEIPEPTVVQPPPAIVRQMAAKPENAMAEALEDRDPNNLNQHVQVRFRLPCYTILTYLYNH